MKTLICIFKNVHCGAALSSGKPRKSMTEDTLVGNWDSWVPNLALPLEDFSKFTSLSEFFPHLEN